MASSDESAELPEQGVEQADQPAEVAPLVTWLAHEDCPATGEVFSAVVLNRLPLVFLLVGLSYYLFQIGLAYRRCLMVGESRPGNASGQFVESLFLACSTLAQKAQRIDRCKVLYTVISRLSAESRSVLKLRRKLRREYAGCSST